MASVIEINKQKIFTLEQAKEILPIIRRLTKAAIEKTNAWGTMLSYAQSSETRQELETRIHENFTEWQQKVTKLGAEAKGMWLVDFDNGEGYYCWVYPEEDLLFHHGYTEGFKGRVKISSAPTVSL